MSMNQQFMSANDSSRRILLRRFLQLAILAAVMLPCFVFAQDMGGADTAMCTMMKNFNTILNLISLAVVTIAVIFSGYQIAFAHKRIAEVAPILIGGILIGAASQIAKLILSGVANKGTSCLDATGMLTNVFQHFV